MFNARKAKKEALESFRKNFRLASESPDVFPNCSGENAEITDQWQSVIDPSQTVFEVVVWYYSNSGGRSEERGAKYRIGPKCNCDDTTGPCRMCGGWGCA